MPLEKIMYFNTAHDVKKDTGVYLCKYIFRQVFTYKINLFLNFILYLVDTVDKPIKVFFGKMSGTIFVFSCDDVQRQDMPVAELPTNLR